MLAPTATITLDYNEHPIAEANRRAFLLFRRWRFLSGDGASCRRSRSHHNSRPNICYASNYAGYYTGR